MRQKIPFFKNFNWKLLLIRILINSVALVIVIGLIPTIAFVDRRFGSVLILAIGLGVLNALIKPILQVITFQFVFATAGLLLVVINTAILFLLGLLFPGRIAVDSLIGALIGGALLGVITGLLEALLGTTVPIVPESKAELRARLEANRLGLGAVIDDMARREEQKKVDEALGNLAASRQASAEMPAAGSVPPPPVAPADAATPVVVVTPAEPALPVGSSAADAVETAAGSGSEAPPDVVSEAAPDVAQATASTPSQTSAAPAAES